jgi:hypothetical protein
VTNPPSPKYKGPPGVVPRRYELIEGEALTARVLQLPARGKPFGNRLVAESATGDYLAIPATAKEGWTVLERALADVTAGERITITHHGWRTSQAGRNYRYVTVRKED